jgi:hypothetical protein
LIFLMCYVSAYRVHTYNQQGKAETNGQIANCRSIHFRLIVSKPSSARSLYLGSFEIVTLPSCHIRLHLPDFQEAATFSILSPHQYRYLVFKACRNHGKFCLSPAIYHWR